MQAPTATENQTAPATLLHGLRERARSDLQTTLDFMKGHASTARQAAGDRVEVAKAAHRLLLEGDEDSVTALVAKKASLDAADADHTIACMLQRALFLFGDSVAKLKAAKDVQLPRDDLTQLAQEHDARLATYKQLAELLKERVSSATPSPIEHDAIVMAQAKEAYGKVLDKSCKGFESVRQRALLSFASRPAALELLQSLPERAHAGWMDVNRAAVDRYTVAKAGKKSLDEGGEATVLDIAARKACLDAATSDKDIASRVETALALFETSASLLKTVSLKQAEVNQANSVNQDNFVGLAEEHEARARTYRQIAEMIRVPVASPELSAQEWDAVAILKVKDSCNVVTAKPSEAIGHVRTRAAGACETACA